MAYICEKPAGSCPGCSHYRYDSDYGGKACFAQLDKKKLDQKYLDVLENHDWQVSSYTGDGRVELQKYSPAGEDFNICVEVEDFPRAVAEYAADFDPDEHIEMWIEARHNGVKGVPSTRELVHDAEDIDKMLQELASALREAEETTDFSGCDEATKTTIMENAKKLAEKEAEEASAG